MANFLRHSLYQDSSTRCFNSSRWQITAISLLAFAIYTTLSAMVPLQLDDYLFRANYLEYTGGDASFSLGGILNHFFIGANYDNARLSNFTSLLFSTLLPAGIFPLLNALMIVLTIRLILSFSRVKTLCASSFMFLLIWGMLIVFLPWRNSLLVMDYSLNYIWSGAISLLFIFFLFSYYHNSSRSNLFFTFLLLLPASTFHEGFAIPIATGLWGVSFISISKRRSFTAGWWAIIIIFTVIALLPLCSPAMLTRGSSEASGHSIPLTFLVDYFLPLTLIISLCLRLIIPKFRSKTLRLLKTDIIIVAMIAMVVSVGLSLFFNHTPRMSYLANLLAVLVVSLYISRQYLNTNNSSKNFRFRLFFASIFLLACILTQSIASIIYQHKLLQEHHIIMQKFKESSHGSIFYDNLAPRDCPVITLYMPVRSEWSTPFSFRSLHEGMKFIPGMESKNYPAVIPENLKNSSPGSYPEGMVVPMNYAPESSEGFFRITDINGKTYESYATALPYINEKGDSLSLLRFLDIDPLSVKRVEQR